jgi:outer membrane protein
MVVALAAVFLFCADARAAEVKIGVMSLQKIISLSDSGQAASKRLETRGKELEAKFKPEQDALIAFQKDIEKKSSAWSDDVKAEKGRQFQKMQRDFQVKTEDARFELKQMKDKEMEPILKALLQPGGIVEKVGKDGGYSIILEASGGVLYANSSVDLSDTIVKRLNSAMGK